MTPLTDPLPIAYLMDVADNWKQLMQAFPQATHFRLGKNVSGLKMLILLNDKDKQNFCYEVTDLKNGPRVSRLIAGPDLKNGIFHNPYEA